MVEGLIAGGHTDLLVVVAKLGRRWANWDALIDRERSYRVGEAVVRV